mmetsp:Transcript_52554/g.132179  ORF Transcript_52554/g.132179 Transcript_52554/m.132179 type:complete len:685 (+) Transcript_52554:88-2142(+)
MSTAMRVLAAVVLVVHVLLQCSAAAAVAAPYSEAAARQAALFAAAAYCDPLAVATWTCQACVSAQGPPVARPVLHLSQKDFTFGYVTYTPLAEAVVVAFRGTCGLPFSEGLGQTVQSILNWVTNADFKLVDYPGAPGAQVHEGFFNGYQGVADQIRDSVKAIQKAFPSSKLLVVGHSLGGALATVAAADLHAAFPNSTIELFTFGAPRAGNLKFVQLVEEAVSTSFRVVNGSDPVPQVPLVVQSYQHIPTEVWYTGPDTFTVCSPATGEDPACFAAPSTDVSLHEVYLGLAISDLCHGPAAPPLATQCGNDSSGTTPVPTFSPVCDAAPPAVTGSHCDSRGHKDDGTCYDCSGDDHFGRAYWGPTCSNASPPNCDNRGCSMDKGNCFDCTGGVNGRGVKYGRLCWDSTCGKDCPAFCDNRGCDFSTGLCYDCTGGSSLDGRSYGRAYWSSTCTRYCPENCDGRGCDFTTGQCFDCRGGTGLDGRSYGRACHGKVCTEDCPARCDNRGCDFTTGKCYDCEGGPSLDSSGRKYGRAFWGETCENFCPPHCDNRGCDFSKGTCFDCTGSATYGRAYWGDRCSMECPSHCDNRGCGFTDGKCFDCAGSDRFGRAFWGSTCQNASPPNCDNRGCKFNDGTCYGCASSSAYGAAFWGSKCEKACPGNCDNRGCRMDTGECYGVPSVIAGQ